MNRRAKRVALRPRQTAFASKTEAAFSSELELWRAAGRIIIWRYEPITLRLGPGLTYRPDFWLVFADGSAGFVEVKGYMRDDARAKLLAAVEMFPEFRWFLVRKNGRGWAISELGTEKEEEGGGLDRAGKMAHPQRAHHAT